ncbi:MAG: hypothetical protein KIH67_000380 [Candidatus Moranbacteria bacterium]|nr:hypothetical protein [Candidatus Moranbacteria bacterium]
MKNLSSVIKSLPEVSPKPGFEERIFLALESAQMKELRMKLAFIWSGLVFSGGILFGSIYFWKDALIESPFWSLVSLVFSDASIVLAHMGEFAFSLLETLPVMPLMAIFAGLATFNLFLGLLGSFRVAHRQERPFFA